METRRVQCDAGPATGYKQLIMYCTSLHIPLYPTEDRPARPTAPPKRRPSHSTHALYANVMRF